MKRILCYGDSNTWGFNPVGADPENGIFVRYDENTRWTLRLEKLLGPDCRICEAGYNGRTTVFEEEGFVHRNGEKYLEMTLESAYPLDWVILALGTNDTKHLIGASVEEITAGMARLVDICQKTAPEARILLACPLIVQPDGKGNYMFCFDAGSTEKGHALQESYRALAEKRGCTFFDVNAHAAASPEDGVHLTPEGHKALAEALEKCLRANGF